MNIKIKIPYHGERASFFASDIPDWLVGLIVIFGALGYFAYLGAFNS